MVRFQIVTSNRNEFVEITSEVRRCVKESGIDSGIVVVYCPHTTAGITIQENADPDVVRDMILWLDHHVPHKFPGFRHAEGNSDSHIKASLMGSSATVLIEHGRLVLGTWQGIYLFEHRDRPHRREIVLHLGG